MKRIVLTAVVLLAAGAALFAQGAPATPPNAEPVKIAGKVTVPDKGWATITDGGKTYSLLYPRYGTTATLVKDGDQVTLTGYVVPGPRWSDGKTLFLRVTELVTGGKTYVFPGAGRGPRGGRGTGPRNGP